MRVLLRLLVMSTLILVAVFSLALYRLWSAPEIRTASVRYDPQNLQESWKAADKEGQALASGAGIAVVDQLAVGCVTVVCFR